MRKSRRGIGAAACAVALVAFVSVVNASNDPLKPYVVLILDTSGSMGPAPNGAGPTGSGPPSCGGQDSRIDHARCAINKVANSYGDMVFALGRFREVTGGSFTSSCDANGNEDGNPSATFPTPSGGDQCASQGPYCGDCVNTTGLGKACVTGGNCFSGVCTGGHCAGAGTCTTADREFELITPLVDGNNQLAVNVTDFVCGQCSMNAPGSATVSSNEIWGVSPYTWTPLAAVLNGAKRYWAGQQATDGTVIWPAAAAGFAPIANDPTNAAFLPVGCNPAPSCTTNCCASQCRPYITILLTDGAESCTPFANTTAAAASMLQTDVGGKRYKVLTKPIGFGVAPGDAQIEGIAHAGGAADGPGNEGYYANDEASLELAISQILKDAIKTEVCNGVDDDCDGAVDEGFNKGGTCDNGLQGACRRTGTYVCKADGTGVQCNAPNATGSAEICNGIDDDCDGSIDEGVAGCNCVPQGETCNNMDDDCDGTIDEGITRPCGVGTCQGTEHCSAGVFVGCTATPATTEICNGLDDDCDGVKDGITQSCSNLPPVGGHPAGDPRNNPGTNPGGASPGCIAEGPSICVCHPGNKTCPANGPGTFGPCTGEVGPTAEICNGLDDDCDGTVDEGTAGQDCSTNCGIGTTACVGGVITCNATTATDDSTCDGVDDDCDGLVDEDWVSPGACGNGVVCNGMEKCINGMPTCVGDPIGTESCNCLDDDCDGTVDENAVCPNGSSCTNCQCAFPCAGGEFPCPLGKACVNNFCVADPCFGKDCPMVGGDKEVCVVQGNAGVCVTACSQANCAGGLVCKPDTGECVADNCSSFPDKCTAAQVCINGVCSSNPCAGVNCPTDQYCVGVSGTGTCVNSCVGVDCPTGQRCELGTCQADPCGHPCPHGQVCTDSTGMCETNPCNNVLCPQGEWCDPHGDGSCSNDPCVGTTCPGTGQVCIGGTCDNPVPPDVVDAEGEAHVTTGGGGGCNTGGDGGFAIGLALLGLARRKRGGK